MGVDRPRCKYKKSQDKMICLLRFGSVSMITGYWLTQLINNIIETKKIPERRNL